jgi:integrase
LDHLVPLSEQALALLQALYEFTGEGRLMFPGLRHGKAIRDATFIASLRRMCYEKDKMCACGFCSMARTLLNEQGYSADVIENQLARNPHNKIHGAAALELFRQAADLMRLNVENITRYSLSE